MSNPESRSRGREWLARLGLAAAAVLVTLLAAEFALRAVPGLEPGEMPILTRYDPLLGWSLAPDSAVTNFEPEYRTTEWTNASGLRGADLSVPPAPDETRILLLGDSFAEGYTVEQGETLGEALGRTLDLARLRVINAGVRGWSTDQELLWFRSNRDAVAPAQTVLLLFLNDVCFNASDRYWRGAKPRFVVRDDTLALEGVPVPPPPVGASEGSGLRRALVRSALVRLAMRSVSRLRGPPIRAVPPERAPWGRALDAHPCLAEGWDMTERLIVRLREEVTEAGSGFLVFWIPSREAVYDEDWQRAVRALPGGDEVWSPTADGERLAEICARNELECILPLEAFRAAAGATEERLYYARDPHWTPAGHALAGRILAEALHDRLPGAPSRDAARWP